MHSWLPFFLERVGVGRTFAIPSPWRCTINGVEGHPTGARPWRGSSVNHPGDHGLLGHKEALGANNKKSIRLDPYNSYPYLGMSMVFERLEETELAEKHQSKATSLRYKEVMASYPELSTFSRSDKEKHQDEG